MKSVNIIRFVFLVAVFATAIVCLSSCGSHEHDYSPLDSYVKAVVQHIEDSTRHANEVRAYLDSLNLTR